MTPPAGYASTEVWQLFETWCKTHFIEEEDNLRYDEGAWKQYWDSFRDGYSAGLAEQDV